jgi:diketogulonate reductase-like aldo/keto reductase
MYVQGFFLPILIALIDSYTQYQLGLSYVDLYLIHSPRLAQPDIPTVWAQMEKVKEAGLAK